MGGQDDRQPGRQTGLRLMMSSEKLNRSLESMAANLRCLKLTFHEGTVTWNARQILGRRRSPMGLRKALDTIRQGAAQVADSTPLSTLAIPSHRQPRDTPLARRSRAEVGRRASYWVTSPRVAIQHQAEHPAPGAAIWAALRLSWEIHGQAGGGPNRHPPLLSLLTPSSPPIFPYALSLLPYLPSPQPPLLSYPSSSLLLLCLSSAMLTYVFSAY